ncbi:PP2C family protein-serine/threonine phosphatase [Streptacidiphilus monticola]|uniref:PP2C family protein-serine/threonine phosphatase n=1 Tax=Streptacidiphilus monticola TaxID=2161674 RepID=A0ABW1G6F6_9ACTN
MINRRPTRNPGDTPPLAPSRPQNVSTLLDARFWVRFLPILGVMAVVAVLDLVGGRDTYLAPLVFLVPPLAALLLYPLEVLLAGSLGMLLLVVLTRYDGLQETNDLRLYYGTLIGYGALALAATLISHLRILRARQLVAVSTVAEAAQLALLRPPEPVVGCVRVAVRYVSAAEAAQIGGDLYSVLETPFGTRVIIGDVRGKGLPAVRTAGAVLGAFREAAYDEEDLAAVAARLDRSTVRHAEEGEFVTALLVEFRAPGEVRFVHCGHVAALRLGPDGKVRELDPPDPWVPLGLAGLAEGGPKVWTAALAEDDLLVLCTDGVVEARGKGRNRALFYPLTERVARFGAAFTPETLVRTVHADLLRWTGGPLRDDAALMAVGWATARREGEGEGGGHRA